MSVLFNKVYDSYLYSNYEMADSRLNHWFLVTTPWPMLIVVGSYLYFVTNCGIKWMENRKPFKIDNILIVYNIIQIVLNGYIFIKLCLLKGISEDLKYKCQHVDYSSDKTAYETAQIVYLYYITKYIDLLDTVFFILKKNNRQITFLHLYHHSFMVGGVWFVTKYFAGGHATFIPFLNSFVHSVMYGYYLITALRPEYKKNLWWKKHITQLQLGQFILIFWHLSKGGLGYNCEGLPTHLIYVFIPQVIFITMLFVDFYAKAYK